MSSESGLGRYYEGVHAFRADQRSEAFRMWRFGGMVPVPDFMGSEIEPIIEALVLGTMTFALGVTGTHGVPLGILNSLFIKLRVHAGTPAQ
jgi:hypothetical protein